MKTLTTIYWTRALLGVAAGLICALLSSPQIGFNIFNGVSIALLLYVVTYYIYKPLFLKKVEKPQKIFTTGVGVYFLTWIVMWTLFNTLLYPHPAP